MAELGLEPRLLASHACPIYCSGLPPLAQQCVPSLGTSSCFTFLGASGSRQCPNGSKPWAHASQTVRTRSPHRLVSQKKKPLCELNPATVSSILKMVTNSKDPSHPPNIYPTKDYMSWNQERKKSSDWQGKPSIPGARPCGWIPGQKPFYPQLRPHTQIPPGSMLISGSQPHNFPIPPWLK